MLTIRYVYKIIHLRTNSRFDLKIHFYLCRDRGRSSFEIISNQLYYVTTFVYINYMAKPCIIFNNKNVPTLKLCVTMSLN